MISTNLGSDNHGHGCLMCVPVPVGANDRETERNRTCWIIVRRLQNGRPIRCSRYIVTTVAIALKSRRITDVERRRLAYRNFDLFKGKWIALACGPISRLIVNTCSFRKHYFVALNKRGVKEIVIVPAPLPFRSDNQRALVSRRYQNNRIGHLLVILNSGGDIEVETVQKVICIGGTNRRL